MTEPKIGVNRGNAGKGRPKGARNKATAEIKELAQEHTVEALGVLMTVIRTSKSDAARVSAIKELFDRGYGKAKQTIDGTMNLTLGQALDVLDDA